MEKPILYNYGHEEEFKMTFAEAAGIMIGGSGGSNNLRIADNISYTDTGGSGGKITEEYGTDTNKKTCTVNVSFSNKNTPNEQVTELTFYDENGKSIGNVSFNGFYVG